MARHEHKDVYDRNLGVYLYRKVIRSLPINSGLTILGFNKISNALFSQVKGPLLAHTTHGVPIVVDPQDYHGRILYLFGTNDRKVQRTANCLLRRGDVFLDIGANYGTIGLSATITVGDGGEVHLFEPQPALCAVISRAISDSKIANVRIHQMALFDAEGEMTLARPPNHSGMASLMAREVPEDWLKLKVPVHRTGLYIPPLVKDRPFGAKIDIEGAECHIVPDLLSMPTLRFMIFEGGSRKTELFELIIQQSFMIYGLAKTILRPLLMRVDQSSDMNEFHDFVAVHAPDRAQLPKRVRPDCLGMLLQDR